VSRKLVWLCTAISLIQMRANSSAQSKDSLYESDWHQRCEAQKRGRLCDDRQFEGPVQDASIFTVSIGDCSVPVTVPTKHLQLTARPSRLPAVTSRRSSPGLPSRHRAGAPRRVRVGAPHQDKGSRLLGWLADSPGRCLLAANLHFHFQKQRGPPREISRSLRPCPAPRAVLAARARVLPLRPETRWP
jgi:hypothetical protein